MCGACGGLLVVKVLAQKFWTLVLFIIQGALSPSLEKMVVPLKIEPFCFVSFGGGILGHLVVQYCALNQRILVAEILILLLCYQPSFKLEKYLPSCF